MASLKVIIDMSILFYASSWIKIRTLEIEK